MCTRLCLTQPRCKTFGHLPNTPVKTAFRPVSTCPPQLAPSPLVNPYASAAEKEDLYQGAPFRHVANSLNCHAPLRTLGAAPVDFSPC
jgi:hypothetical protein